MFQEWSHNIFCFMNLRWVTIYPCKLRQLLVAALKDIAEVMEKQ